MDDIMGRMKDDKGLFQGGRGGRMFGRIKDARGIPTDYESKASDLATRKEEDPSGYYDEMLGFMKADTRLSQRMVEEGGKRDWQGTDYTPSHFGFDEIADQKALPWTVTHAPGTLRTRQDFREREQFYDPWESASVKHFQNNPEKMREVYDQLNPDQQKRFERILTRGAENASEVFRGGEGDVPEWYGSMLTKSNLEQSFQRNVAQPIEAGGRGEFVSGITSSLLGSGMTPEEVRRRGAESWYQEGEGHRDVFDPRYEERPTHDSARWTTEKQPNPDWFNVGHIVSNIAEQKELSRRYRRDYSGEFEEGFEKRGGSRAFDPRIEDAGY